MGRMHNPASRSDTTRAHRIAALMPHNAVSLAIAGGDEIAQYQAGFELLLDWRHWMPNVPQALGVDSVDIPLSQLPLALDPRCHA